MSGAPTKIAPAKWIRLTRFLETLPPGAAGRLFAALELDRAKVKDGAHTAPSLPHAELIAALRPIIRETGARFPARRVTAQRLFFTPFEDFLIAARRGRKRRARIPRSSLAPIWSLLQADAACAPAARASAQLDRALEINAPSTEIEGLERALFAAAAEGFRKLVLHAEDDAGFRADLTLRLAVDSGGASGEAEKDSGSAVLRDLGEMSAMLPIVEHLKAMQRAFPRPVASLTEDNLFEVRRIYAAAHDATPDVAAFVLLCLAGRMEAPWRAMRVYYHIAAARDSTLIAAREDAQFIVESLFEDLEGAARALERDAEDNFDADDARVRLVHFADSARGLIEEARGRSDAVTVNRAEACRDVAAAALSRYCEQAFADIRLATPARHAGGSSKLMALRPDIGREIAPAQAVRAEAAASFLARADDLARRLDRADASHGLMDEARNYLARYAGDLVLEIRAAEGDERRRAKRLMEHTLKAAGPLVPANEIALLKERAAAAAVSA